MDRLKKVSSPRRQSCPAPRQSKATIGGAQLRGKRGRDADVRGSRALQDEPCFVANGVDGTTPTRPNRNWRWVNSGDDARLGTPVASTVKLRIADPDRTPPKGTLISLGCP